MRALGLLIMCVLLLAVMQASYLIVDAHQPESHHVIHHVSDNHHRPSATKHDKHGHDKHQDRLTSNDADHDKHGHHNATTHAKDTAGTDTDTISYNISTSAVAKPTRPSRRRPGAQSHRNRWRIRRKYCRRYPHICKTWKNKSKTGNHKYKLPMDYDNSERKVNEKKIHVEKNWRDVKWDRKGRRGKKNWAIFFNRDNVEPKNVTAEGRQAIARLDTPALPGKTYFHKEDKPKVEVSIRGEKLHSVTRLGKEDKSESQRWLRLTWNKKKLNMENHSKEEKRRKEMEEEEKDVEEEEHEEQKSMKSLYGKMLGDSPQPNGNDLKNSRKQEVHRRKSHIKNKKRRRKGKRECKTSDDCNYDECCVPRGKTGQLMCQRSHKKDGGKKCTHSCLCRSGMQCFVKNKRNGKPHKKRPGKKLFGRCINPAKVNPAQGYFLPTETPSI